MKIKTRNNPVKKNDLETNHSFSIPQNIQKDINERGFHLYNWIGEQDVKLSIERDFLSIIKSIGPVLSLILLVPAAILIFIGNIPLGIGIFFGGLMIVNIFLLIYLSFLAIKRSNIFRKNSHILMTDSSILINGKIIKYSNFNKNELDIKKVSDTFEEDIFKPSNIGKTKKTFMKQVISQFLSGYTKILKRGLGLNKNFFLFFIILILFYTVYVLSLGMIYFAGVFFIGIFGSLLNIINKQVMLISGHKITSINSNFENIDDSSKKLVKEKKKLSTLLTNAMQNDWKDSLLTKINSGIKNINGNAEDAIDTSKKLKKEIEESKYKEMFNFSIYHSWIRGQIYTPISEIIELLENNLIILQKQKILIEKQITVTKDPSLIGPMVASKKRIEMRIHELDMHISKMKQFISKLK